MVNASRTFGQFAILTCVSTYVSTHYHTRSLTAQQLTDLLQPETPLEARFLEDEEFRRGLLWGLPRYGHPEGTIWRHILEVNRNIDALPVEAATRRKLRTVCWVHDTFKHLEHRGSPRDWSKHHSIYARQFLARFVDDPLLLNVVELHDEAYYCWRLAYLYGKLGECERRIERLRKRVGSYWQLYYLFFKCDTCTGDKNPAPLLWFERHMRDIEVVEFARGKATI